MFFKLKIMVDAAFKRLSMFNLLNDKQYEQERMFGELLRNVHSIEKGLSLRKIRAGFGYAKISEAYGYALKLTGENSKQYDEAVLMFVSALDMYLQYHESIGYLDERMNSIKEYKETLEKVISHDRSTSTNSMGGYQVVTKSSYSDEEIDVIESLFLNRHSVREFSQTPVEINKVYSAVQLAHHCPSACNRQGYRVHIVTKEKFSVFDKWFDGVGGFADELDKLLLITGDVSAYRFSEDMQYIVSASVFAAYLTLALQTYGIGCCFIQRPVVESKEWVRVRNELNISGDEQIVCALGIGNLLDEYKAPISHRLSLDTIVTIHN